MVEKKKKIQFGDCKIFHGYLIWRFQEIYGTKTSLNTSFSIINQLIWAKTTLEVLNFAIITIFDHVIFVIGRVFVCVDLSNTI